MIALQSANLLIFWIHCNIIFYGVLLIFPFLPFMISDFFPDLDHTEIGKKAGFLGSSYYIGSFAGSLMVSINTIII